MNTTTASTPASPCLLAVAYGGGHIAMMLPVLKALRARLPGAHIDLLALTTARRAALDAGEAPLGYADLLHLLSPEEQTQALDLGRALQTGNTHPDIPEAETLAYLGINAWDLQRQLGAVAAQQVLTEKGRHGFYPIGFFRRVLSQFKPDLVLATNSPRSEQAVVDAASEAGVPSLSMLDLFGLAAPPEVRERTSPPEGERKPGGGASAFVGDAFAARTRHPSRVCVLSDAVRDNLMRAGWAPEIIAITGNPAFDALHSAATRQAAAAFRAQLGWQDKKVVLLAAHPEPRSHPDTRWPEGDALPLAMEAELRRWTQTRPDAALIVRHHPNHWHRYPRLPDSPEVHFSVPGAEPIDPLILAADGVVVQTTTVGLQAASVGIPVLAMQCSPGALSAFSFATLGIARGVADVPDLPAAVNAVLDHRPEPTTWARPTLAADAVADEALALLGNATLSPFHKPAAISAL